MSIFSSIATGLSKAENFLLSVFTKTEQVEDLFVSLAPQTKAAILATAYDVFNAASSAEAAAAAAATGNIPAAFTLSQTTLELVKAVIADGKADASVIATDLKALGISI